MFKARYRIVRNPSGLYAVQTWRWWWPFWSGVSLSLSRTVEAAEDFARHFAGTRIVVKDLGRLP